MSDVMAKRPIVDVWEVLMWQCPACCERNEAPSWVTKGDQVNCKHCHAVAVIGDHYADCRPQKFTGKKATA